MEGTSKVMPQSVQSTRMDIPPTHIELSAQFVVLDISSIYQHQHAVVFNMTT